MTEETTNTGGASSEPQQPRVNPFIKLPSGHRIYGGSFFVAPDPGCDYFTTINLMAERDLPADVHIPIRDYSIPSNPGELIKVFEFILADTKDVYVGCWGGVGRTGLFMASLLRYLGDPDPIATVRAQYNAHAVETEEQAQFVADFPKRPDPRPTLKF